MQYLLFLIGFLVRLLFIPSPGFKADMAFWKAWGLALADKGLIWVSVNTNYNYPPGFAYVLYVINKIYAAIWNPYNISQYWNESNIYYLAVFKALPIISDILVVLVIILIARQLKEKSGILFGLFFFLSPAVILDGAIWGQVDQFGLLLFLISIYLLMRNKYHLAAAVFTLSFLMKFQNLIFIPLFYLYIYKKYSFSDLIQSFKVSLLVFIVISAPFFLAHESAALLRLLTINSDWFPQFSLNAFNIWWIASGLDGMKMIDKNLVFGITSAKTFGLLMFIGAYFAACLSIYFSRAENLIKKFILSSSFAVFAFFHLLTESHERYLFHLLGLLPLLIMFEKDKKRRWLWIFTIIFSLFFFANMYIGFIFNYPDVLPWGLSKELTKSLTLAISLAQIIIFIYFSIVYLGRDFVKHYRLNLSFIALLIAGLFLQNANYILHRPIQLTKLTPLYKSQDYLEPQYGKNLNSRLSPFQYDRLSSNYAFYENGIASHANSAITYSLDGKFSKFNSDYGIDSEGAQEAEVYFIIEGDGRELFRSAKKTRFENPSTIELDIKGIDRLVLKIQKAGESNYGHHADWLRPVLIR